MTFTIPNMKRFANILDCLKGIATEAVLNVEGNTLTINAFGTSGCNALYVTLPIIGDVKDKIGIRVDEYAKVLKTHATEATFTTEGGFLVIKSKGKTHKMAIFDPSHLREAPNKPHNGAANVVLTSKRFDELLKEATAFTTLVELKKTGDVFTVASKDDTQRNHVSIDEPVPGSAAFDGRGLYDTVHFSTISSLSKEYVDVLVSFQLDYPLCLTYADDDSKVVVLVAQRAEV